MGSRQLLAVPSVFAGLSLKRRAIFTQDEVEENHLASHSIPREPRKMEIEEQGGAQRSAV
jgi:hypothetical protein